MTVGSMAAVLRGRSGVSIVSTIVFAVALVILLQLGLWQMQRLAWKTQLLADLQVRADSAPVAFDDAVARVAAGEDLQFQPVELVGQYHHAAQVSLPGVRGGEPGWRVVTPFVVAGAGDGAAAGGTPGGTGMVVLVERGFVPGFSQEPAALGRVSQAADGESVQLVAQIRPTARRHWLSGVLTPPPDLDAGIFYALDRRAIVARAAQLDPASAAGLEPLGFDVIALEEAPLPDGPARLVRGEIRVGDISNRHLEYVVTWFGLAAALVGVFVAWQWGRWRAWRRG